MYLVQVGMGDSIFERAVLVSILYLAGFSRIFWTDLYNFALFLMIWMGSLSCGVAACTSQKWKLLRRYAHKRGFSAGSAAAPTTKSI